MPLMTVSISGMNLSADLFTGPEELTFGRAVGAARGGALHQRRGAGREGRGDDLRPCRLCNFVDQVAPAAGLRLDRMAAPLVDDRGLSARRLRRLREARSTWCISRSARRSMRSAPSCWSWSRPTRCSTVRQSGRRLDRQDPERASRAATQLLHAGRARRLRGLRLARADPSETARRIAALRRASACAQAEQHRPDLGADDRGHHPLCAREHLSRPDRDPARRRRARAPSWAASWNCCRAGM